MAREVHSKEIVEQAKEQQRAFTKDAAAGAPAFPAHDLLRPQSDGSVLLPDGGRIEAPKPVAPRGGREKGST